ncbi:MAG: chorismate-binding protein [Pseudomonadota bacterium]|nr:chorismate-binding protein [Pseudomonadota bacterium]
MILAQEGETGLVSRRLPEVHDPVALHAALTAEGGEAPILFRRTGGRALILIDSALRLEGGSLSAKITATSEGGVLLLDRLAQRHAAQIADHGDHVLHLRFKRCNHPDEDVRAAAPTPLDVLRSIIFGGTALDRDDPFALVALGIAGFDHVDMLEVLPPRAAGDFPDLLFLLAETLVVVEPSGATRILAMSVGSNDRTIAHRQHHLAAERVARLADRCARAAPLVEPEMPTVVQAEADLDDGAFMAAVARLKEHIAAGDIFQVVPSRSFRAPCDDGLAAFRRLVAADPSAYQYAFDTGHGLLFGASPETALELRRDGSRLMVSVSPIAGTRPRGATADGDDRLEADLRLDSKEVAEHLMLVDLARNDVARVSRTGTRQVVRMLGVERFARVMHLVSTVEGEVGDGFDAIDAMRACLNVGTLSGAPKLRAIELIRSVETRARGPYGGAIGWIAGNGTMDSAVVIRSALVRDGFAEVRAGAGVVQDSDPATEAAETRAKASAVLAALGAAA